MEYRLKKLSKILGPNKEFIIYATKYENKYHRQPINPYFLYLSFLPESQIIPDSILYVKTSKNYCSTKIYANFDEKLGIFPRKIYPVRDLPRNISEMSKGIKEKIDKMRVIKDKWEIRQIKYAIKVTKNGLNKMKKFLKSSQKKTENNLEAIFYKELVQNNCSYAYPPIIASGKNASFIHYNLNNSVISNSNLVLMDCGARNEYGYCADITETILPRKPTKYQKIVYEIVEKAFNYCYEYLIKNKEISLEDLQEKCLESFEEQKDKLRINGNKKWDEFLNKKENLKIIYPHFIGHQVGLEVHDPGNGKLKKNMVFTIEPGLYFPDNNELIPDEYKRVGGVRIEKMILMGKKPIILG